MLETVAGLQLDESAAEVAVACDFVDDADLESVDGVNCSGRRQILRQATKRHPPAPPKHHGADQTFSTMIFGCSSLIN